MTMRPFTDVRGGLTHMVDAQIGRAFPVVHKVYQHLDAIEYIAQVYEAGRSRDIVIRTNHTKEWIEWQYKGEDTWTILFKFSDLLGADIADVVAAEQAIAAQLEALRGRILQLTDDTLVARDQAQAAELGAVDAKNAAETAQASALASAQNAVASAAASVQSAQGIDAVKAATEVIAATVESHRTAVALSAQQAADSATNANSAKDTAVFARAEAEGFASAASTSSTEAKAAQQAAESSAQAAGQSEAAALVAANEAATSASAANVSAQTAAAHQKATEAAATAGAQHLADVEAQVVAVEALKQESVDALQAGLAAKAGAEEAAVSAAAFAKNADVSAAESATSANEAEASANAAELSAQSAAAHKAEAENQAVGAATSAQEATDKASAADASALAAAASATTATEKLGEVSTLHVAVVAASTTATEAADTTTTHLAQVTALHSATESFAQAAQASAEQADIAATAADVSASDALQLRNETQGFHDAASTMVVDAAQVSADLATVQTLAQEVQLAAGQAQSNALAAADSAGTAVASASAAADSATTAQTSASEILGQVTTLTGRLDEADSIVTTVTALRDETLSYKLAAQDSTTNAQAVAADRAAVADMLVDVQANATAVSDAVVVTTSAASAAQLAASSAEDSSNAAAQNLAAAQAAQLAAESAATLATDANTVALAALTNHTAAADPHTQYLTKAESTDALATKVDKVAGKQLSTEDYTAAEKSKLAGIAAGANAYTHPANHPANIITQDANNRFVTDAEKAAWNAKQANLVSGTNIKTLNGESLLGEGNLVVESGASIPSYSYENRASLRTLEAEAGDIALVDGLGLFVFAAGSDEPYDDESCFATATGKWLMECPHWDVVDAWQLPDNEVRDEYDEDEPLRFASSFASKVMSGTATCAITSVATVSSASFTGTVTGASVGDRVIATPPAELGATAAETGRLSYHARVSAANTVTVMLTNGSAAAANTNAAIRAAWPITVIKS